jgi:hypothetical protein
MEPVSPEQLAEWAGTARRRCTSSSQRTATGSGSRSTPGDLFARNADVDPPVHGRPTGPREFEIVEGDRREGRFDFPRDGFVNMGILAARVE